MKRTNTHRGTFGISLAAAVLALSWAVSDNAGAVHNLVIEEASARVSVASALEADDGDLPSNKFSFSTVKRNEKKGTAKLTVRVPGPGHLELAKTKKLKADAEYAEFPQGEIPETYGENLAGRETLTVEPRGKAKKKLNRAGKAKVKATVTYTPDGGEPNTKNKKLKLKKR